MADDFGPVHSQPGVGGVSAVAVMAVILLVIPLSSVGSSLGSNYFPPFTGASATASINSSTTGCAHASALTLPFLNGTTGLGGFRIASKASACSTSISQFSNVSVQLVDRIPIAIPSGRHAVNVTWNLTVNATARAYGLSTSCSRSGRCWDDARYDLYADAVIKDLTNGSVVSSSSVPPYVSGIAELDNVFGWVKRAHFNGTFTADVNLSGTFVASHRYAVVATVYGDVHATVLSSPAAVLAASINLNAPYGASLSSIRLW